MPSERQLLEGSIRSLQETIRFHERRPNDEGANAAAAAARHLEDARAKLAALRSR